MADREMVEMVGWHWCTFCFTRMQVDREVPILAKACYGWLAYAWFACRRRTRS